MDLSKLVNGENFKDFAEIIIENHNFSEPRNYKKKNIVFCKTNYIPFFFNEITNLDISVILISHQSDYEINYNIPKLVYKKVLENGKWIDIGYIDIGESFEDTPAFYRLKPIQVKKWFGINVNHTSSNLIPIPIGVENHKGTCLSETMDIEFFQGLPEPTKETLNSGKNKITDLIYCNFKDNHPDRSELKNYLIENKIGYIETQTLKHKDYLEKLSNFLFVACPRGNGIDTFRIWETLYMGSIPVVKKHLTHTNLNLPIWQVESWDEINDPIKLEYWIDKYKSGNLFEDISQMEISYWTNLIKQEYDRLS